MQSLLLKADPRGVYQLSLNRPQSANALDEQLISELLQQLQQLAEEPTCRLLLLTAEGKHFCAGADLGWMQRQAAMTWPQNLADAKQLAALMQALDTFPSPTLALVQGACFGGAVGLICCCDIAIASTDAKFCLSEVKLGLLPGVISPYISRTLGPRQVRRYALSAEPFDAPTAMSLGLLHGVSADLNQASTTIIDALLQGAPAAQRQCKALLAKVAAQPLHAALLDETAEAIATARAQPEAHEGMAAFFAKRPPSWSPTDATPAAKEPHHD